MYDYTFDNHTYFLLTIETIQSYIQNSNIEIYKT